MDIDNISVTELAAWLADEKRTPPVLLDVREASELQICQIQGSVHMSMHTIPARLHDLNPDNQIVCICHHGGRSLRVAHFLSQNGFENVLNLVGGVHAWAEQVDPAMQTY